jgi:hypothetical protein
VHRSWSCTPAALALSLVWGCETPPAFAVPPGPPRAVAVDVELPIYVLGNWTIGSFKESLRLELAKYRVHVVDLRSQPMALVEIDLGRITYRQWQEIDVRWVSGGESTPIGAVHLLGLETSTVEAAAEPVAAIIARKVWGVEEPEQ